MTATSPLLTSRFQDAFALASAVHATQVRKQTTVPYLAHLMSVAALVLEHGGGEDAAIAGLLHDAVEDSPDGAAMAARIREQFGDHVADTVLACSDAIAAPGQPKAPWPERKRAYIGRLAQETNPDTLLVSACDKLHNARSIVADLRAHGSATWQRFQQQDPDAQLWYFDSLVSIYRERHIHQELLGELDRTLAAMHALAEAA